MNKDVLVIDFQNKIKKNVHNSVVVHSLDELKMNKKDYLFVIVIGEYKIKTRKFVINIDDKDNGYATTILSDKPSVILNMLMDSLFRVGYVTIDFKEFRDYFKNKTWKFLSKNDNELKYSSLYKVIYTSSYDEIKDIEKIIDKTKNKCFYSIPIIGGKESYEMTLGCMKKVKNIVFDLGNVLLKDTPASVLDLFQIDESTKETIRNTFFKYSDNLDLGYMNLRNQYNSLDVKFDNRIKNLLLNYYKYREYNKDILKLMQELSSMYNVYILSNNNKEVAEYIKTRDEFKCVKGFMFSCDKHLLKPHKDLYNLFFNEFNLDPEETYFIDDKDCNINVSRKLGMRGTVLDYKHDGVKVLLNNLRDVL